MQRYKYLPPVPAVETIRVDRSTNQSIPTGVGTVVLFDVVDRSNTKYTYNSATGLFTLNRKGIYLLNLSVIFAVSAVGIRELLFFITDGVLYTLCVAYIATSFNNGRCLVATVPIVVINNNTTIDMRIFQNSGAALTITGGVNSSFGSISKMG